MSGRHEPPLESFNAARIRTVQYLSWIFLSSVACSTLLQKVHARGLLVEAEPFRRCRRHSGGVAGAAAAAAALSSSGSCNVSGKGVAASPSSNEEAGDDLQVLRCIASAPACKHTLPQCSQVGVRATTEGLDVAVVCNISRTRPPPRRPYHNLQDAPPSSSPDPNTPSEPTIVGRSYY